MADDQTGRDDTNHPGTTDATNSSADEQFEEIYDQVDVDELDIEHPDTDQVEIGQVDADPTSSPPPPKRRKRRKRATGSTPSAKKSDTSPSTAPTGLDGIDDIHAYISQAKEKQSGNAELIAQDGTSLRSLPGLYAIVPHAKGDHKLVYLSSEAPADLQPDPKERVK